MDDTEFWSLVERLWRSREQVGRLTDELNRLPAAEVAAFAVLLAERRRRAGSVLMRAAGYLICDSLCDGDDFEGFSAWLVGLGPEAFGRVADDPDALAVVAEVTRLAGRPVTEWSDAEFPDWPELDQAVKAACESAGVPWPDPAAGAPDYDDYWDFEHRGEAAARLPRIARMFPLSSRAERERRGREAYERFQEARTARLAENAEPGRDA